MIEQQWHDDENDQELFELTEKKMKLMDEFGFEQELDLAAERYEIEQYYYEQEEKNTYKRR